MSFESALAFPRAHDLECVHCASILFARQQLRRFTYKPGWTFAIVEPLATQPMLHITFECRDTYNPDGPLTRVGKAIALNILPRNPDLFAQILAREVQELEIHESREWLKRDGKIWDNPHAVKS